MRLLNWAWKASNERYRPFIVLAGWKTRQLLSACGGSDGFLSTAIERHSGRSKNKQTKKKTSSFVSQKDVLPCLPSMRKFTQLEINRLRSFLFLHFQWLLLREGTSEGSPLGRWASRPCWVLCLIALERKTSAGLMSPVLPGAEPWLCPSLFLMLSSPPVCESAGWLFVFAVAAFFIPGFIAVSHSHPSKRILPVVLLLDIIGCHLSPRYPVLWPLIEKGLNFQVEWTSNWELQLSLRGTPIFFCTLLICLFDAGIIIL